jgi:hypothetical protein
MQIDSTTGPGNLSKASPGTSRYLVTFSLTRNGRTESRQRAWRAPTKSQAMSRVKQHYEKEGFNCEVLGATEIANSSK